MLVVARSRTGQARWAQIAQSLRERIVAGEWRAGDCLPAEAALADAYDVAMGTLRAAVQVLVDEGLVERRHGLGNFVRAGLAEAGRGGAGLSRFFRWSAPGQPLPQARVTRLAAVAASDDIRRALRLPASARVLRLTRLRLRDAAVLLHETLHLPLPRFAAVAAVQGVREAALLYPLFARSLGVVVHRAIDELAFARMDASVAHAFDVEPLHPAVRLERVAFELSGQPVEHRVTLGRAEDFHYRAELR